MLKQIDYSLYVITTEVSQTERTHLNVALASAEGGATIIQLREKQKGLNEIVQIAKTIKRVLDTKGIPLAINDDLDVAVAVDAPILHIGQGDVSIKEAREIMGKNRIIGVSVSNVEEAILAIENGADYLGVGPIFSTISKDDAGEPIGLESLIQIRKEVNVPIVAIGGINHTNVQDVIGAGADGVAVISAIAFASNMKEASQSLLRKIKEVKEARYELK